MSICYNYNRPRIKRESQGREIEWIHEVNEKSSKKCAIIPWMHEEKIGYEKLNDYMN